MKNFFLGFFLSALLALNFSTSKAISSKWVFLFLKR